MKVDVPVETSLCVIARLVWNWVTKMAFSLLEFWVTAEGSRLGFWIPCVWWTRCHRKPGNHNLVFLESISLLSTRSLLIGSVTWSPRNVPSTDVGLGSNSAHIPGEHSRLTGSSFTPAHTHQDCISTDHPLPHVIRPHPPASVVFRRTKFTRL